MTKMQPDFINNHPQVAEAVLNIKRWTEEVGRLEAEVNSLEQAAAAEAVETAIRVRVEGRSRGRPAKSETVRRLESLREELSSTRQLLAVEQQALPRIREKVAETAEVQDQLDEVARQYDESYGQMLEHYRKAVDLHRQCFDLNEQYQQVSRAHSGWVTTTALPSPGLKGGFDTGGRNYHIPSLREKVEAFLKDADEALYVSSGREAADDQRRRHEEEKARNAWLAKMRAAAVKHAEHPEVAKKLAAVREAERNAANSGITLRHDGCVTLEGVPLVHAIDAAHEDYWRMVASLEEIEFQPSWIRQEKIQ